MAKMIPPVSHLISPSPGEPEIARRLAADPDTDGWIVLHSLDIAEHRKQISGECDFIVIVPSHGILFIEVKACNSLRRDENGLWFYGTKKKGDPRGPFKQASENMHSIKEWLFAERPDFSRIVCWSAVIFPYIPFSSSSPEWHDWQVIDSSKYRGRPLSFLLREVLLNAREHLKACPSARWFRSESKEPYEEQCKEIADLLRPRFENFESPKSRKGKLTAELIFYTGEQLRSLDIFEGNERVLFRGPAGTGKTLLAIEAARRTARQNRKVLLICFNRLIGNWISEHIADEPNITVSTIHSAMMKIAGSKSATFQDDNRFWEEILPERAIEKIIENFSEDLFFDSVIVDEAQDILKEPYLDFLDLILRGGLSTGNWMFFGDFSKQAIYMSDNSVTVDDFKKLRCPNFAFCNLSLNCRNTPRIAAYAPLLGGLTPDYSSILRPDDRVDPILEFYSTGDEQVELLEKHLNHFKKEKFSNDEITILSTDARNPCVKSIGSSWKGKICKYEKNTDMKGRITYCTIQSFKGLEAPVIIVTDISRLSGEDLQDLFYIAVTRALNRLVILIDRAAESDIKRIMGA